MPDCVSIATYSVAQFSQSPFKQWLPLSCTNARSISYGGAQIQSLGNGCTKVCPYPTISQKSNGVWRHSSTGQEMCSMLCLLSNWCHQAVISRLSPPIQPGIANVRFRIRWQHWSDLRREQSGAGSHDSSSPLMSCRDPAKHTRAISMTNITSWRLKLYKYPDHWGETAWLYVLVVCAEFIAVISNLDPVNVAARLNH